MTGPWPFPDLRNGTTVHHITDTHFGAHNEAEWAYNWQDRTRADLETLRVANAGHVHTGDAIHFQLGTDPSAEDAAFVAWKQAITGADGKPFAQAIGNHDAGNGDPRRFRTPEQWATAQQVPAMNHVTDMGGVRIITVGPDVWDPQPDPSGRFTVSVLSEATLAWLDQQLTLAGSTPCMIGAHNPLAEQYGGGTTMTGPPDQLVAIIDGHPNAVAWLSGHLHVDIHTKQAHAAVTTVGSRRIYTLNGPPAGGGRLPPVSFADHQWQSPNQSLFLTYMGDAMDVRWRDHNSRRWTNANRLEHVRHLLLTA